MKYFITAILGAILTPFAHKAATAQRGYFAIGGEFLIIPLLILIVFIGEQIIKDLQDISLEIERDEEECKQKERASQL